MRMGRMIVVIGTVKIGSITDMKSVPYCRFRYSQYFSPLIFAKAYASFVGSKADVKRQDSGIG